MANTSAPITAISTPADEQSTLNTRSRTSSSFLNRFSNASFLSLASVRTLLPQYTVVDTLEDPPASPLSSEITIEDRESPSSWNNPESALIRPPRYTALQPLVLTQTASTTTPFEVEGDPQTHGFRYSYPIRPKNPWATLHLQTRVAAAGDSSSLQNQNQPRVPRIWSCDPITGTVQLDLDSPQNIQQISITVSLVLSSDGMVLILSAAHLLAERESCSVVSYWWISSIFETQI